MTAAAPDITYVFTITGNGSEKKVKLKTIEVNQISNVEPANTSRGITARGSIIVEGDKDEDEEPTAFAGGSKHRKTHKKRKKKKKSRKKK